MAEMGGGSEDTEAGAAVAELPKTVHAHAFEKLAPAVVGTVYPRPLGQLSTPVSVRKWFAVGAQAPLVSSDEVRKAVRDALREGGFKPTGRNKPASEYLRRAVQEGWLSPERGINVAVDICNAVSLHSGLPMSVIDRHRSSGPWQVRFADTGTEYVFNPAGQRIAIGGAPVLADADGPCANAVKDAQRTKTDAGTTTTLTVFWGLRTEPSRTDDALKWYIRLTEEVGGRCTQIPCEVVKIPSLGG